MHFEQTVRLRPEAQSYYNLGRARLAQGRPREAVSNYEAAVTLKPEWTAALNELAWILATHPQADVRDGPAAVILAERACQLSSGKETRFLATLDAAYAEAGRFAEAIRTAEKTRELAVSAGDKQGAQEAETRLILYRKNQPYRR
jgi:cytochrome c-type biogenesis protein CcmH/NrfG